jgi:MinD superfamily P-loop ATPase
MSELVVISGNGGTGKTSVVAALAALAHPVVLADCNVDASNLSLVFEPRIVERSPFFGGPKARIEPGRCVACGKCKELCRFDAVLFDGPGNGRVPPTYRIDPIACEGCGVCVQFCTEGAIEFDLAECAQWFVSEIRCGLLVHARLAPGAGNSGRLVHHLRQNARELAAQEGRLLLCDGAPGIGRPVIACLAGADLALLMVEPTRRSLHGLPRAFHLCRHFGIEAVVAINKWDINESLTEQIEAQVREWHLPSVGRIRYDPSVSEAQIQQKSVVEYDPAAGIAQDLRCLWESLESRLGKSQKQPDKCPAL